MKTIGKYTYSVDENNAIRIWIADDYNAGNPPFVFQPEYPDKTPFASVEDATSWAEQFINDRIEIESNQTGE